jgi:hypothetical protein
VIPGSDMIPFALELPDGTFVRTPQATLSELRQALELARVMPVSSADDLHYVAIVQSMAKALADLMGDAGNDSMTLAEAWSIPEQPT